MAGEVIKIGDDLEVKVLRPLVEAFDKGFGLEVVGGGRWLSPEQSGLLFEGSRRVEFEHLVDEYGFAKARIDPDYRRTLLKDAAASGWNVVSDTRAKLDSFWHRDKVGFTLLSAGAPEESTGLCARGKALEAFFKKLLILTRKSPALKVETMRVKGLVDYLIQNGLLYGHLDTGSDDIGNIMLEFLEFITNDPNLTNRDFFMFQTAVDAELLNSRYVHDWQSNSALWISRKVLNRRICRNVEGVSGMDIFYLGGKGLRGS